MTTIIKAADAAEFLAMVPHMLGFTPRRSIVLVPFAAGRSLGGMRFDLPPDDVDAAAFASSTVGLACRVARVDAVVAIVYCDDGIDGAGTAGLPHRALADAIEVAARQCGLRLIDLLCVAAESWAPYAADAGAIALRELPPVPEQLRTETPPHPDHTSGADLPSADLADRERTGRALAQLERAVAVCCGDAVPADDERIDPAAFIAVSALDDIPVLFETWVDARPEQVGTYERASLIWCLARPSLRDIGLTAWLDGLDAGDDALDAQLRWEDGAQYPTSLAERIMGEGERPDGERLRSALELTRHLAAVAPRAVRPGTLSVCAWLAWALGRSTHAERYASWACEIDPEHGLSRIVLSMVHAGHLPDWAFHPGGDT